MPPTARTWLDIRGNAGPELDQDGHAIGDNVGQFFASENAIPFAEYDSILPLMAGNRYPNLHIFAAGSANGNSLRSAVSGSDNNALGPNLSPDIRMFNSSRDTYTLSGTPAQVGSSIDLTAHFDITGTASLFGASNGNPFMIGQAFVNAKMGVFNTNLPSFDREDLRVSPFDATTNATFDMRRFANVGSVNGIIDLHMSHTFTAIVGTPFDIGYELNVSAFDSFGFLGIHGFNVDLSHTATIGFDVPAGYSLTSELGWTQVPEPSSIVLVGIGGLLLLSRCRARRRAK